MLSLVVGPAPVALQALEQAGQSPMDFLQGGSVPSSPRHDRPIGLRRWENESSA
jgi:hypothetical protein